jgi:hypothetical protein
MEINDGLETVLSTVFEAPLPWRLSHYKFFKSAFERSLAFGSVLVALWFYRLALSTKLLIHNPPIQER